MIVPVQSKSGSSISSKFGSDEIMNCQSAGQKKVNVVSFLYDKVKRKLFSDDSKSNRNSE